MSNCEDEDDQLAKWTFLRYCVLGLIMLARVVGLRNGAMEAEEDTSELTQPLQGQQNLPRFKEHPYKEHPGFTLRIQRARLPLDIFWAGCLFVLTEGVGLAIYFSFSAVMDNVAVFLLKTGPDVCTTVKAVSLYTVSLVTFLPNVMLGSWLQRRWYNDGTKTFKALFALVMAITTMGSFVLRMWLAYTKGYANQVDSWMSMLPHSTWRVVLAVAVPPMVDGIQSTMLIMTGSQAEPLLVAMWKAQRKMQKQLDEIQDMLKKQTEALKRLEKQAGTLPREPKKSKIPAPASAPAVEATCEPSESSCGLM